MPSIEISIWELKFPFPKTLEVLFYGFLLELLIAKYRGRTYHYYVPNNSNFNLRTLIDQIQSQISEIFENPSNDIKSLKIFFQMQ